MSQTVERALSIIGLFADRTRSLGEVAEHLGVTGPPQVVAAVSITALRVLAPPEQLREHPPELIETCVAISRDLGWTGDHRP